MRDPAAIEIVTHAAAETQAVGEALGAHLAGGQVIALHGDLGAGKTTFVQGLARGLGVLARVSSPTFVLINEYPAGRGLRLLHVDTYRLGGPPAAGHRAAAPDETALDEAEALGLAELLDDPAAVIAIEWAERVAALLPADHLLLELYYGPEPNTRILRFTPRGPRSAAVVAKMSG